jgi:polyphosphate kinase 2 (PPK2 family)
VEKMLVDEGIILVKFWFSVSDRVQEDRFRSRLEDPMRRWKLSDTDLFSITRWEDYSRAKDAMFAATDVPYARWWTIESDDKRASRINAIKHLLTEIPYEHRVPEKVTIPDRPEANSYDRPPKSQSNFVADHAKSLTEK